MIRLHFCQITMALGVLHDRLVRKREVVEYILMVFALVKTCGDVKYDIMKDRPPMFMNGTFNDKFLNAFREYAQDVELTNLPQMVKEYFEYPREHASERRERKRMERKKLWEGAVGMEKLEQFLNSRKLSFRWPDTNGGVSKSPT